MDYQVGYVWSDGKIITQSLGLIVRGTAGGKPTENQINIMSKYVYEEGSNTPYAAMFMNGEYLLVKNAQGDVTAVVDSENGETLVEYQYDPWGQVTSTYCGADDDEATKNLIMTIVNSVCPLTYRGYNYDFTTGLYYLQSRYYNPEWGRFLNVDDVKILASSADDKSSVTALSANPYLYCNNNPVNRVDYTGQYSGEFDWVGKMMLELSILFYLAEFINDDYFYVKPYVKGGWVQIFLSKGNFINKIYDCVCIDEDATYHVLAAITNDLFREQMSRWDKTDKKRSIVFSDECLKEEIQLHANGYMAALDMTGIKMPIRFSSYAFRAHPFSSQKRKEYIKGACETIDIREDDVISIVENIGFKYYFGIRDCYKYTKADPFYSTSLKMRVKAFPKNDKWQEYLYEYSD